MTEARDDFHPDDFGSNKKKKMKEEPKSDDWLAAIKALRKSVTETRELLNSKTMKEEPKIMLMKWTDNHNNWQNVIAEDSIKYHHEDTVKELEDENKEKDEIIKRYIETLDSKNENLMSINKMRMDAEQQNQELREWVKENSYNVTTQAGERLIIIESEELLKLLKQ